MLLTLAMVLTTTPSALAKPDYNNSATTEGWAWARIKEGKPANFNERCKTAPLDARATDEKSEKDWQAACRQLPANFLVEILTKAP